MAPINPNKKSVVLRYRSKWIFWNSGSRNRTVWTYSFGGLSIILLIMSLILILGFKLIHYKKSGLKRSFDIVRFLRPDKYKLPIYYKMIVSNIVAIILIIISCWLTKASTLIYLIYLFAVIQLLAVNYRTEYEIRKELTEKAYSHRYLILAGITIVIIYYLAIKVSTNFVYLTGFAVILLVADYYILMKS